MKSLNKKYLVTSGVITALVIIAVILVNLIAASLTTKLNLKLDLTKYNQYEISDTTKEVMAALEKEVTVKVMGTEAEVQPIIKEYLQKYSAMNDNFKLSYVDVYKNQVELNKYQAKGQSLATGDIILECGERWKIINAASLFESTFSFEPGANNYSFPLESKLTNGLVVVTGQMNEMSVYFIEGHGETVLEPVKNSLDTLGFTNGTVNLVNSEIPEDAGLLISVVPTADYTVEECKKLDNFFDKGGNFFMVFSPGMEKLTNIDGMLASWGIVPNYDLVLEKDPEKVLQYEFAMLTDTYGHEVTNTIRNQSLPLVSYQTSSFELMASNVHNATLETILETTDMAIGKKNLESTLITYEEGDVKGPLALSVLAEKYTPKTSRLAVIGSAGTLQFSQQYEGNSELLSGLVSWLTNNNNGLKINPKIISETTIEVPNATIAILNTLLVWIVPILILLAGIIIWIRRRYL